MQMLALVSKLIPLLPSPGGHKRWEQQEPAQGDLCSRSVFKLLNQTKVVKSMHSLIFLIAFFRDSSTGVGCRSILHLSVCIGAVLVSAQWGESGLFFKESIRNIKSDPIPLVTQTRVSLHSCCSASWGSLWLNIIHWDVDLLWKLLCAQYLPKQYSFFLASIFCKTKPSTFCLDHILSHGRRSLDTCRILLFWSPCTCRVANSNTLRPTALKRLSTTQPILSSCFPNCSLPVAEGVAAWKTVWSRQDLSQ